MMENGHVRVSGVRMKPKLTDKHSLDRVYFCKNREYKKMATLKNIETRSISMKLGFMSTKIILQT